MAAAYLLIFDTVFLFFFFWGTQAAIVFYAAVGTRQSVPYFEVRCSSLSVQLVLESPTVESYSAAWQPETIGRRKRGGRKAVFFPVECVFSLSPSLRKPTQTWTGLYVDALWRRVLWIIRALKKKICVCFADKKHKNTHTHNWSLMWEENSWIDGKLQEWVPPQTGPHWSSLWCAPTSSLK